jgi:putative transposase
MKRKRHSPEQIIRKLREADGMLSEGKGIAEVCQPLEVVEATFHRWRNQYGGMKADDAKQLKELQVENGRLKKLVAEQALDKQILEAERDRGGSVKGGENGEPGAPQG